MKEKLDFPAFTATLVQPRIVNVAFKKIKIIRIDDIKDIAIAIKQLAEEKKVGVFLTFKGFIQPNDEVLVDPARKEIQKHVFATAYVVKSMAIRIGIKFFMNFHGDKEGIPRNIFETKEKAIAWLVKVKEEQKQKDLVQV